MKLSTLLIVFLITTYANAQSASELISQQKAEIRLSILDQEQSMNTSSLSYSDIPKQLNFRGTVVEALSWKDVLGDNILILTTSGHYIKEDIDEQTDRSEINAYLFQRVNPQMEYELKWRIFDFNECFGVDWHTGFIPNAMTITDVNTDGISEISIPYVLICRGGLDPGTMKVICYENETKYALRGQTMICYGKDSYGGDCKPSDNLKEAPELSNHLQQLWDKHKCETKALFYED